MFVTSISVIGLVMLIGAGAVTNTITMSALVRCVPFLAAPWLGGKLFAELTDTGMRRLALGFMATMGVIGLIV